MCQGAFDVGEVGRIQMRRAPSYAVYLEGNKKPLSAFSTDILSYILYLTKVIHTAHGEIWKQKKMLQHVCLYKHIMNTFSYLEREDKNAYACCRLTSTIQASSNRKRK